MQRRLRYGLSAVVGGALAVGALALPASAQPAPQNVALTADVPAWATGANVVGSVSPTLSVDVTVGLAMRDQAGAERFALDAATPGKAQYGKYLTFAQFKSRFGPTAGQANRVAAWMRSRGLHATVDPTGGFVNATASAATVDHAFATTMKKFNAYGMVQRGPATAPIIPASLRADISAVGGLTDVKATPANVVSPAASSKPGLINGRPSRIVPATNGDENCSHYWREHNNTSATQFFGSNQGNYICGYVGRQITTMYGIGASPLSGEHHTIAIVDSGLSPTGHADLARYINNHLAQGLVPLRNGQYRTLRFTNSEDRNFTIEEMLDLDAAHTIAPGANLLYVASKDATFISFAQAIAGTLKDGKASVISNSYGAAEVLVDPASRKLFDSTLIQAAAQGVSVQFSTGDSGDFTKAAANPAGRAVRGAPSTGYPASSPYATAVGGTAVGLTLNRGRQFTTGWEDDAINWKTGAQNPAFIAGATGGPSHVYATPSWQKGLPYTNGNRNRATPDIAALASDVTGLLIGVDPHDGTGYQEFAVGGTSLACPLVSGMTVVAVQRQNHNLGLLTPAIYKNHAKALRDVNNQPSGEYIRTSQFGPIVIVNNRKRQTLQALNGFDNVTGWGEPNGQNFLNYI